LVSAKLIVGTDHNDTGVDDVECTLSAGVTRDDGWVSIPGETAVSGPTEPPFNRLAPVSVTLGHNFRAGGDAIVACRAIAAHAVNAIDIKLTAVRLGSLIKLPAT
jgi:hypothetical protein